jgi:hypothetical protein
MTEQPDSTGTGESAAEAIGTDPTESISEDSGGRELYHGYSVDDENQPMDTEDSTVGDRGLEEPMDEGYSPPEKWSAAERYGNTPLEEEMGETLEQRMAQEIPEPDPYEEAANQPDNVGGEVGDQRAGRLVAEDQGFGEDTEKDLVAEDVGIDGAAASAEEAAVHLVDEDTLGQQGAGEGGTGDGGTAPGDAR